MPDDESAAVCERPWLVMTTSRFAELSGKTTTFHPFTPGPHALVWAHLLGFIKDVPKTGDAFLVVFGRETRASSKAPTYALFAQFFFFALFSNRGATSPFAETGALSVLSVLWSRFVPATLGVFGSLLLRLPWFPLNIEARVWDGARPAARPPRPASRRLGARRTKARTAFSRRRWWPSLVRAFFAATFGWLDPGRDRTGAPRVFVASASRGPRPAGDDGIQRLNDRRRGAGGFDGVRSGSRAAAAAPAPAAVDALTAMGFDEGSVRRALADAGNDLAVATESLLEDGAR